MIENTSLAHNCLCYLNSMMQNPDSCPCRIKVNHEHVIKFSTSSFTCLSYLLGQFDAETASTFAHNEHNTTSFSQILTVDFFPFVKFVKWVNSTADRTGF
jgi:hypothetical protein